MIKFRILSWGDYPGLPGGLDVITRILTRDRERQKSQRRCQDGSRGWGDANRTLSQEMKATSRGWKRQGMDFPL